MLTGILYLSEIVKMAVNMFLVSEGLDLAKPFVSKIYGEMQNIMFVKTVHHAT